MIYNAIELRNEYENDLKEQVSRCEVKPCLAILQVGNVAESNKYVGNKLKALERVGMTYRHIHFSEDVQAQDIMDTIQQLNYDYRVHGIMVQLPLPDHLKNLTQMILDAIVPAKDVDGLTTTSMGYIANRNLAFSHLPCTAKGVHHLLNMIEPNFNYRGKNIVVIGKGITSGLPFTLLAMSNGANVVNLASACSKEDLALYLNRADLVVTCAGVPNLIDPSHLRKDCILINVGMSVNEEGKLVGDYDPNVASDLGIRCTSIINSTGIMTVQMLLSNVYDAYLWREED